VPIRPDIELRGRVSRRNAGRDRLSGDIAPVRRQTTLVIALTLLMVVALAVFHRAVKRLREPTENVMPPPAASVDMLDSSPGSLYVKAVVRGDFAEVFSRTAWMQARVEFLRESLGEPESGRAADEFFQEVNDEFIALENKAAVLGPDGIEDRVLFGRALGCEEVYRKQNVMRPAIRPAEPLCEYRYRLTYPNATLTPRLPADQRIKLLEASIFTTARGKVVKANVIGNAVIHADTIERYY